VRLGIDIPNEGDLPLELGVVEMARAAEDAGADSVWSNDHLVMVDHPDSHYPYGHDGRIPWDMDRKFFDTLTTCAFISAATKRVRVGTDVMVLPQRPLLHVAKTIASIDALNGGRFVLGVGIGWFRKEMEALGFSFATRGTRADEMIPALRGCWSGRPRPFAGREITVGDGIVMEPRPARESGPPIVVGGHSKPAVRRAARLGDGWIGVINGDALDRELPPLSETLQTLARELQAAEREDEPFERIIKLHTPPEVLGDAPETALRMAAMGFDEVIVQPFWESVGRGADSVRAIRDAIDRSATLTP
jgi:probable F420-dependent oxidoreductase